MRSYSACLAALTLVLVGCSGGGGGGFPGGGQSAEVSGLVYDNNGDIVRNATIFVTDNNDNIVEQTVSDSNGAYVLRKLPPTFVLIQGQIAKGSTQYIGQNLAELNANQRTMTLNVSLFPSNMLGSLSGTVSDTQGNLLSGVKLFATPPTSSSYRTSAYTVSDNTGHFFMGGLLSGVTYTIQANGLGFNSAFDTQTFSAGQTTNVAYTLPPATNNTLAAPANVTATAFTEADIPTTPGIRGNALAALKYKLFPNVNPNVAKMVVKSKKQVSGINNPLYEVDLSWTQVNNTSLLGYGVYRTSGNQPLSNIDFFRDPLAQLYEDMDPTLQANLTYTYAMTTISTGYTGTTGESPMSNQVTATLLPTQDAGTVTGTSNPTFSWQATPGAQYYILYLYNTYPDFGVADIFDDAATKDPQTSVPYSGPTLTSGTYYYYIVGVNQGSGVNSMTVSNVASFTVP